ncbi:interferon-induced 35 kDa protein isoform X2 [Trichosurus vulpecula]|uniref:interferon-induced 35 kDa protein isoform X2 n=1 Tax=Trichosurus vulpecula TaxID=9337 RepID=UPI00186AD9CE|nr:interferon-induced 35 kDa protein isoform X2 [Trichosurus vulpecula]
MDKKNNKDQMTSAAALEAETHGPQKDPLWWRLKLLELCNLKEEQKKLQLRKKELKQLQTEDSQKEEVPFPVPQAVLVFLGQTKAEKEVPETLLSNLRIHYPLPESSALISFENPEVAKGLLQQQEHNIILEECRLRVRIQPVELSAPTTIKVLTWICHQKVLVIGLPSGPELSEEQLLDKLELFFCKPSNGGGEVKMRELLSGAAVLGFTDDKVAERLTQICHFMVPLGGQLVPLRVFPYIDGNVQEIKISRCSVPHSVLVVNIPDVLDAPDLQDILEIHFQKPTRGGGEVEALMFVAPGSQGLALFTPEQG